jgi:hypothetical protein
MSQWEASGTPSTTIPRRLGGAETITRSPRVGRSRRFFSSRDYHYSMLYVP